MVRRLLFFASIAFVVLFALGVLVYWRFTPAVTGVSPADGSTGIFAGSELSITFSREMQPESVTEHLEFFPPASGSFTWQERTLIFTPHQPWSNGETITIQLSPGARAAGLLSLPTTQETSWTFTVGEPRLVYLYPTDGPANLYILNLDTNLSERLTNYPGGILDFSVNHIGNKLYFSRKNGASGSVIYRLDLIGQEGNQPVEILTCPSATCRAPEESPAGDYLAYERTANAGENDPPYPQVWLLPLPSAESTDNENSIQQTTYRPGDPEDQTLQPHWSPSGLLTYYDTNLSAFVFHNPESGENLLFPNQTGQPGGWHPSGEAYVAAEIFFVEINETDGSETLDQVGSSQLIRFNLSDLSTENLTGLDNLEDTAPAYSPDGVQMAFARKFLNIARWTPGRQIWLKSLDGFDEEPLTNDPYYNHYEFAWSPTGELLAYVRFNQTQLTEPPEIWIVDPQTTLTNRLIEGGYAPQWVP